jgi:hypothetical protein
MKTEKLKEAFDSPYDQFKDKNGQQFKLIKTITEPDFEHDIGSLPMYIIEFEDGEEIEAWPEEIFEL